MYIYISKLSDCTWIHETRRSLAEWSEKWVIVNSTNRQRERESARSLQLICFFALRLIVARAARATRYPGESIFEIITFRCVLSSLIVATGRPKVPKSTFRHEDSLISLSDENMSFI